MVSRLVSNPPSIEFVLECVRDPGREGVEDLVGDGIRKAIAEGIVKREELYVSASPPFIQ